MATLIIVLNGVRGPERAAIIVNILRGAGAGPAISGMAGRAGEWRRRRLVIHPR
jgi:hypothetical protein